MVVVDVQNDFISGSLAIINCPAAQNGEDVSEGISLNIQCIFLAARCSALQSGQRTLHRSGSSIKHFKENTLGSFNRGVVYRESSYKICLPSIVNL